MDKFEVVEIEGNKKLINHYKTYEIKRKGNALMTEEDVKMFYDHYKLDNKRSLVIGLGPTRWSTLKTLDDPDLKKQDANYWKNKVDDPTKFMQYTKVQISLLEQKKLLTKHKNKNMIVTQPEQQEVEEEND